MIRMGMVFFGFASGIAVAAGVFAFIAAIGLIPRMAKRTQTQRWIPFYEDVTVLGGLFGTTAMFVEYRLPSWNWLAAAFGLLTGIFVGVLAMALTEVLNVMPVMMRRLRLTEGLQWLVVSFALGQVGGALLYFLIEGFYVL